MVMVLQVCRTAELHIKSICSNGCTGKQTQPPHEIVFSTTYMGYTRPQ